MADISNQTCCFIPLNPLLTSPLTWPDLMALLVKQWRRGLILVTPYDLQAKQDIYAASLLAPPMVDIANQ